MKIALNLHDADGFYEQLLDAHQDLSREQSELLNARLILLLDRQGDQRDDDGEQGQQWHGVSPRAGLNSRCRKSGNSIELPSGKDIA